MDVVDAERARLDAERQAAQIRGQRMTAAILLIKALGGGWEPSPAKVGGLDAGILGEARGGVGQHDAARLEDVAAVRDLQR